MVRKSMAAVLPLVFGLLLWAGVAVPIQAEDTTIFLPLVMDDSLRGEVVFYQYGDTMESAEIVKVRLPDRQLTQLTHNDYLDSNPDWSPDGAQIVYISWPQGNGDIYVMNADGTAPIQLTESVENDRDPVWSPDGTQIAFVREYSRTVWSILIMDRTGITVTRVTTGTQEYAPSWSPDGTKLAFSSFRDGDWELYVMELAGNQVTQLTDNDYADFTPVWSPDGSQLLAMAQGHDPNRARQLYTIAPDGSNQEFLAVGGGTVGAFDWSPDGQAIVYVQTGKFFAELAAWRFDTTDSVWVTTPDAPMFENSIRAAPRWR